MINADSVQMFIVAVIFAGAAVVLLGSFLRPRQVDPMGMFGLPSVCAIACRPAGVKTLKARPIVAVSQCGKAA